MRRSLPRTRSRLRPTRAAAPLTFTLAITITLTAAACSSDGSDDALGTVEAASQGRTFCEQAQALQTFQNDVAVDLADPTKAPAFIEVALDQLRVLGDKAPEDIKPEIDDVVAGYEALDAELAANDYRLDALLISNYSDETASEATDRLDTYLATECGLRAGRPDVDAPQPFTAAELNELLATPDDADENPVAAIDADTITQQLIEIVGLSPDQADCLVTGLGDDAAAVLLGESLEGEALTDFQTLLADCSIDPEDFG